MSNQLKPPAVIQRGRKDLQYIPQQLEQTIAVGALLYQAFKNGDVVEIDPEKVAAAFQHYNSERYQAILWVPVKKDGLGDVAFTDASQITNASGPQYLQMVEKSNIEVPTGPKLVQ